MTRTKQTVGMHTAGNAPQKQLDIAAARKNKPAEVGIRRPHRFPPGTVAFREIQKPQKSIELFVGNKPFVGLVREIAQDMGGAGISSPRLSRIYKSHARTISPS